MSEQTRTFDGTTGAAPPQGGDIPGPDLGGLDLLDMLREQTQARDDATEIELVPVPIPGLGWRLMCNPDFSYAEYRDWQKASLPQKMRTGRKQPTLLDLDQAMLALLVLTETCEAVEFRNGDGPWRRIQHNGEDLTVKHEEFLSKFNMIDPKSLVRKLFKVPNRAGDAELIKAGQIVIDKAGYGDQSGDDEDPTD